MVLVKLIFVNSINLIELGNKYEYFIIVLAYHINPLLQVMK